MTKEQEKNFLEDLFWTSYRYCIGRHTYVVTLATDMGNYFYNKLSIERKEFAASDIRQQIEDQLKFRPFNFNIPYNGFARDERKPLEWFLEFLNSQENVTSEWLNTIKSIEAYREGNNEEIKYDIEFLEKPNQTIKAYEYELEDLFPWMDLASLFDIKNHKIVVCDDRENGVKEIECYESYVHDGILEKKNDKMGYIKPIPWKYKKVYRPVSDGVTCKYIEPTYIKEIKNYER